MKAVTDSACNSWTVTTEGASLFVLTAYAPGGLIETRMVSEERLAALGAATRPTFGMLWDICDVLQGVDSGVTVVASNHES